MQRFQKLRCTKKRNTVLQLAFFAFVVFCVSCIPHIGRGQTHDVWVDKIVELHKEYEHVREGKTNGNPNNTHPRIAEINKTTGVYATAPYCASYVYTLFQKAGVKVAIPKSEAPRAYNWTRYGENVWQKGFGWNPKYKNKIQALDVIIFQFKRNYHLGLVIRNSYKLEVISAEGNTSEWNAIGITVELTESEAGEYKIKVLKQANLKNEGIYTKFRNDIGSIYAIRRYI